MKFTYVKNGCRYKINVKIRERKKKSNGCLWPSENVHSENDKVMRYVTKAW